MSEIDPEQFSRWFDEYGRVLVLYGRQWLDAAAAEDVVQEGTYERWTAADAGLNATIGVLYNGTVWGWGAKVAKNDMEGLEGGEE